MKAVLCKAFGPASSLVLEEIASPSPAKNEILLDVHAAGVNFPDTLIIEGKYQFKPPFPSPRAARRPEWSPRSARSPTSGPATGSCP